MDFMVCEFYLNKSVAFFFFFFLTGTHYVAQPDLELKILCLCFPSAGITGICATTPCFKSIFKRPKEPLEPGINSANNAYLVGNRSSVKTRLAEN
jgi:hypothetical protein